MNLEWKQCFKIGVTLFLLYLCTLYWNTLAHMFLITFNSITPIILGACLAYLINLLMGFLERTFFPNGLKGKVMEYKRTICMILSVLFSVGFVVLLIYMIIPELIKCIYSTKASVGDSFCFHQFSVILYKSLSHFLFSI